MMIDHNDGLRQIQQLRPFRPLTGIHIYNNHGCIHIHNASGRLGCHKHITVIFRIVHKMINHRAYRCGNIIDNNKSFLVQASGRSVNADGRTEAVQISNLMAHNRHLFFALNDLSQGMGLYTGTDTG